MAASLAAMGIDVSASVAHEDDGPVDNPEDGGVEEEDVDEDEGDEDEDDEDIKLDFSGTASRLDLR